MCLFHGICDFNQIQKYAKANEKSAAVTASPIATTTTTTARTTSITTTTTVTSATAKTPGPTSFALLAQIQRCIQTPEFCNTNMIPTHRNGATTATTAKPKTTTTTTTTLDPLEIAR